VLGESPGGLALAMAWFAVAEPPIRYAAEVKPYATDLLVSLVLLNPALSWRRAPKPGRWLWALAAVAPLAVALSLPSVFLLGGIAAVGLWDILARRQEVARASSQCPGVVGLWTALARRQTAPMFAYGGFLAATGLAVAAMAGMGQYQTSPEDRAYFLSFWAEAFPPSWHDPVALARWLVRTHTGPLF